MACKCKGMSKTELTKKLAEAANTNPATVNAVLEQLRKIAVEQVKATGEFKLLGLGKLKIKETKARKMRNPQTGAMIDVPAKRVVKFSIAKEYKKL